MKKIRTRQEYAVSAPSQRQLLEAPEGCDPISLPVVIILPARIKVR